MFNKIKNSFNRSGKAIDNKCNEIYDRELGTERNAKESPEMAQPSEEVQSESTAAETASCSQAPGFAVCKNNGKNGTERCKDSTANS